MVSDQGQTASTPECHAVRRQLGAELDTPTTDVAAHLERCVACRTEARRLRAAWALLNVVEPRQPSPQFSDRVWAQIAAEESPGLGRRWGGLPVRSLRWAAAGLAVALAAVIPVAVWYQDQHDGPELVAQLDLMESRELLTNLEVVEDLDVLLLLDDP
jgi:predicted anti-sigma-YlaC factor YlaD